MLQEIGISIKGEGKMNKQDILDAFYYRHACKEFDASRKISDEDFAFILETARLSPSSFGLEPWKFLIVQNPDIREKLKAYTWGGQKQLPTCSHLLVCLAKKAHFVRYDSDYIRYVMKDIRNIPDEMMGLINQKMKRFQKVDFALLDSERSLFEWSCRQTYIALGNMMTSAAMIGIDSCPMEGFQKERVEETLSRLCDLDSEKFGVSYMVAFGYRKNPPQPKIRQKKGDIFHWV